MSRIQSVLREVHKNKDLPYALYCKDEDFVLVLKNEHGLVETYTVSTSIAERCIEKARQGSDCIAYPAKQDKIVQGVLNGS